MKAIRKLFAGPGADYTDTDEAPVPNGHVRIKVRATSLCGTDIHILGWDPWARGRVRPPVTLGHEVCGTIDAVGDGVTTVAIGDFVAVESHVVCSECHQCRHHNAHVCERTEIFGVDRDGVWSQYAVVPAENAHRLPADLPIEVAAVQDPLGNAVHAVSVAPIEGASVLVTGAGPIGLFTVAVAKKLGAGRITATEVSSTRADLAYAMGADLVVDPRRTETSRILSDVAPDGFDVCIEMSGNSDSLGVIADNIRPAGFVSLLGLFPTKVEMDLNKLIFAGVRMQCVVGRNLPGTWDLMSRLLFEGLDVRPAVTHKLGYDDLDGGLEKIRKGECGKVVFDWI